MVNIIIILVLCLTSCEAIVKRLTKFKAPNLSEDMLEATNTMLVYCGEHDLVFRCFQLNEEKEYFHEDYPKVMFLTTASGYISKGECTYDGSKMSSGEFKTYATMETCSDIRHININEDGTVMQAKLKEDWWEIFDNGDSEFKRSQTPPRLNKPASVWTLLTHPRQGLPKSGPLWFCNNMYSCGSCTTKRLCAPMKDPKDRRLYQISSEQCNEAAPYCEYSSGGCKNEADPECLNYPENDPDDDFICMRDGYYPDPKSCNKFYTCKDRVAYVHYCPAKFTPHYHPGLKYCVKSDDICTSKTTTVLCDEDSNKGKKIAVRNTDDKLYITCTSDFLLLDRCIGAYKFDSEKQECTFKCPHEGLFLSTEHCKKFIKCSPLPIGGFKEERLECEDGQGFLEEEFACVDQDKVPNCQEASPDFYNK